MCLIHDDHPHHPQIIGGAAPAGLAAPVNAAAVLAMIYAFGNASGAHLSEWRCWVLFCNTSSGQAACQAFTNRCL